MSFNFFLSGICMASFAAAGLFFFKFWKASRDVFYLHFALACVLFSFERVVLLFVADAQTSIRTLQSERASWVYLIRLIGFLVILYAVIGKNRRTKA